MGINRRFVLAAAASAAVLASPLKAAASGTPEPEPRTGRAPGYAIARVRALPTPELNAAIVPDVMATFLPRTAAVPGYAGYLFSQHATDPAATITVTLLADAAAADAAAEIALDYVAGLDPRFVVETPFAQQGPVRIFHTTDRPATELPPFLHGCHFTMRDRINAPGTDIDDVVARATEGLVPLLAGMPGFVLYCWTQTEEGRVAINVWETAEQLAAGNEAIAEWVAANTANTTTGDPVVNDGVIIYADIPRFV
jgi:hypothetical protein